MKTQLGIFILFLVTLEKSMSDDVRNYRTRMCEITAEGHVHEGFVDPDAPVGTRVSVTRAEDAAVADGETVKYLKLNILHCEEKPQHRRFVLDTDEFTVDTEGNIVVNDTRNFKTEDYVHDFSVHLMRISDGKQISNPFSFTVRLETTKDEAESQHEGEDDYVPGAAIFAGVLILFIVFLALFIPFVVRAKRRYREGKPIFKLGSHPSNESLKEETNFKSVESKEPNWYTNTVFNYEEEVTKGKNQFTKDILKISHSVPARTDTTEVDYKRFHKGILKSAEQSPKTSTEESKF